MKFISDKDIDSILKSVIDKFKKIFVTKKYADEIYVKKTDLTDDKIDKLINFIKEIEYIDNMKY